MVKWYLKLTAIIVVMLLAGKVLSQNQAVSDTGSVNFVDSTEQKSAPPDSAYIARAADSRWWKRKLDNKAFNIGEYLEFKVSYAGIPAGTAVLQIPDTINYNGIKCFKVMSTTRSNAFVSMFYKVRDTVYSYIDYDGIFTHYFRKRLHEGRYRAEKQTSYDQRRHLAVTGKDTIPTYSFVQDAFSSMYYIRTQDIALDSDIKIDTHTDKKNYPLKIVIHGKERIKVPAGEFDCIIVEPVMRTEGIFNAKGRIKIWLTDDRYKMPVKMQTEVFFIGSVTAKLKKFRYGSFPEDSLITIENINDD